MATTRRRYTGEFKREAVRLAQQREVPRVQVARELNIHPSLLRKWEEQFASGRWEAKPGVALRSESAQELERLRRELKRVTMERDILKKAVAYFAKEPS